MSYLWILCSVLSLAGCSLSVEILHLEFEPSFFWQEHLQVTYSSML
jgi:hypothetical protein